MPLAVELRRIDSAPIFQQDRRKVETYGRYALRTWQPSRRGTCARVALSYDAREVYAP